MGTTPMPMVQVFAPDGTLGDIPYDRLHDAIGQGAKIAAKVKAPDGTVGFVPGDRVPDALKAGGSRVPLDMSDADGGKPGFWSQAGAKLKSQLPSSIPEAAKALGGSSLYDAAKAIPQGPQAVAAQLPGGPAALEYLRSRDAGAGVGRSALNAAGTAVGVDPAQQEAMARSGNTAGVAADAAVPIAETLLGYGAHMAGPAIGEAAANAPGVADAQTAARNALYTPEGKPSGLAKAISHPVDAAGDYALRKLVGAPDVETKGTALPIRNSPYFSAADYNAGRKGVTPSSIANVPLKDLIGKTPSGTVLVPEPQATPANHVNLMGSVPREQLGDLALAGKPDAAAQLQHLGNNVLYVPSGEGISNVRSSMKLSDLMNPNQTLNPVGSGGARPIVSPADQFESSFGPEHQEVGDLAEWETGNREGVKVGGSANALDDAAKSMFGAKDFSSLSTAQKSHILRIAQTQVAVP